MSKANELSPARQLLGRFYRNERGNVAVIFTFAITPILLLMGSAIDYTRATNARAAMQAALDTTVLMISKDAANLTSAQITSKADSYFKALYTHSEVLNVSTTAVYTPPSGSNAAKLVMTGGGKVNTQFMKIAGFPTLDLKTGATATWGNTKLRVALALDVTGSMNSDGKLAAMKTSAKSLIDTLKQSSNATGDVYVSIVPFAQMVNVGTANKNASWIDWSDWDENYGSCSRSQYVTKSQCESNNRNWTVENHNNWDGCVTDRNQPYDTTKDAPTTTATKFTAVKYEWNGLNICPSQILPMTSLYSATDVLLVKTKIDLLVANGGTNQPIGMHWGWMSLQQTLPLNAPAKDANFNYTDAIILLSDGLNTIDRWYGNGSSPSPQVDARQQILCNNIRNTAVNGKTLVYTIQVNTDGDPESAILKSCADPGQFYPTTTANGISGAFAAIGASLSKLRLAK